MENATDALIIAASVLLLIIALSVNISSFSTLKRQVDDILNEREQIDMASEDNNYVNYYKSEDSNATRVVRIETVISATKRILKENYNIYIYAKNIGTDWLNENLFAKSIYINDKLKSVNCINLSIESDKREYLTDETYKKLYSNLKGRSFNEYIGEYQEALSEGVSSANKQTNRVITFVEI